MAFYLSGHGSWEVQNSEVPLAKVPRGTSIEFWTENGKCLLTAAMLVLATEKGDTPLPAAGDLLGDANGDGSEYRTVPNYTLHPDTPEKNQVIEAVIGSGNVLFVDKSTPLCTGKRSDGTNCIDSDDPFHDCQGLFADSRVVGKQLVWLACRAIGLKDYGGGSVGVNANQYELGAGGSAKFREWLDSVDGAIRSKSPDEFWTYFKALPKEYQASLITINGIRDWLIAQGRDLGEALSATPDPAVVAAVTEHFKQNPPPAVDLKPKGVQQCVDACPECGGQCRWGVEHVGKYDHECMDAHRWGQPVWSDDWGMLFRQRANGDYEFAHSDDKVTVRAGTSWMSQDEAAALPSNP